jgi:hypothetical protein
MMEGMQPPRRMRYSIESRCRFARLVREQGMSPERAAVVCGAADPQIIHRGHGRSKAHGLPRRTPDRLQVARRGCSTTSSHHVRRRHPRPRSAEAPGGFTAESPDWAP